MRKHHKKWNVVQSGHCTVVLLHPAAAAGRQHYRTVIVTALEAHEPLWMDESAGLIT